MDGSRVWGSSKLYRWEFPLHHQRHKLSLPQSAATPSSLPRKLGKRIAVTMIHHYRHSGGRNTYIPFPGQGDTDSPSCGFPRPARSHNYRGNRLIPPIHNRGFASVSLRNKKRSTFPHALRPNGAPERVSGSRDVRWLLERGLPLVLSEGKADCRLVPVFWKMLL